ncbi:RNA polymerase [Bacillus thuringiensis]|uniref:RNA polymerase n=1 Tax=Bacillus thuringiensis TaxID=1428 RepID=UPI003A8A3327
MIFNSEEDLIIAMKKHDQDALKEVIDQYGKLILYIIHKSLSIPIEKQYVDDCYNDVFTVIWFNIDQFDNDKKRHNSRFLSLSRLKIYHDISFET